MEGTPTTPGQPPTAGAPSAKPDLLSLAQGPVELGAISDQPITLKLTEDSKMIYETIGKLAGINVLFDPDYTSRRVKIELNNVSLQEALQIVAMESRTFWRPVTKNTIFVASDTQQKRKEIEENVVRTFYLSNISQPTDLQDVVNALRTVIELQRIQQLPSQNAIVIRGTPDQLALAEKLIGDIDKPKPEVVIDVAVMQVSRNKERDLGILPPTNVSVALTNQSFQNLGSTTTGTGTTGTGTTGTGTNQQQPGGQVTFNTFKHLTSVSYAVNIPAATAQLLFSDADSKIIQNPQIRSLDGAKGSLKIGQRIPVATGSFGIPTVGTGTGGFTGTVNTQFQYIDVGVNIDVTPKIHADSNVTLKVMIDISSRDSTVTIGGIDQPVIGQRKIEHEIRLREGEVNIMGGIFEDQEISSWSGIPGLGQIPLFRYLFAQQKKTRDENEIVFVMVPHIVRHQDLTPLNTRAIDIGAGSSISLRRGQPAPTPVSAPVPPPAQPQTNPQTQQAPQANAQTVPPATVPPSSANLPPAQNPAPAAAGETGANPQPTAPAPSPAGATILAFDPPLVTQAAGSTATVNVGLQNASGVHSVAMQLKYDPNLLQVVNVTTGGFLSRDGQAATVVHRDDGNGTLQISGVRPPGAPGLSGQGNLFTLVFQLKAAGAAAVIPASIMLRDAAGNPVPASSSGRAAFQIQAAPKPQ